MTERYKKHAKQTYYKIDGLYKREHNSTRKKRKNVTRKLQRGGMDDNQKERQRQIDAFRNGLSNNLVSIKNNLNKHKKKVKDAIHNIKTLFDRMEWINTRIPVSEEGEYVNKKLSMPNKPHIVNIVSPINLLLSYNDGSIPHNIITELLDTYRDKGVIFNCDRQLDDFIQKYKG